LIIWVYIRKIFTSRGHTSLDLRSGWYQAVRSYIPIEKIGIYHFHPLSTRARYRIARIPTV